MALDATIGGASANSYVTRAAATTYFAGRLDSPDWSNASAADQDSSLMMATMRLDAETYIGWKASFTQSLMWPRFSAYDRDGRLYSSTAIPLIIQQATFEYALALLREPTRLDDTGLEGFENVQIGTINITPRPLNTVRLPAIVKQLIAPVRMGGFGSHVSRG